MRAGSENVVVRPSAELYPRLVGGAWGELDAPVRQLHSTGGGLRYAGHFAVRRGAGRVAGLLARFLGLPEAGENIPSRLVVTPLPEGERWHRTFGGRPFVTRQSAHASGLLAERIGAFEILFRLSGAGGALFYQQARAALCLGHWRVPLPRALSPNITASERASGAAAGVRVSVRVSAPLAGLLIEYSGSIEKEGAA